MSKNVRISLYILIPVIIWMISGQFVQESEQEENQGQIARALKKE